jgi:ribosomal protein S18 acetylase RimI-like enzyme
MSVITIRPPRPDEADALAELHLRTWAETYVDWFPPSEWGDEARVERLAMWTRLCGNSAPDARVAVAELDGETVGLAAVGASLDEFPVRGRHLWFIYVLASAQGSGAGQALLDEVLGDDPASLWVLEPNARARAFYARNGFVADGAREPTGIKDAPDEIRMVR